MPVLIKFDNTTTCPQQAQVIPDATPQQAGVMSAQQAAQLATLANSGVAMNPVFLPGGTTNRPVNSNDLLLCDLTGGNVGVIFPPANLNSGRMIIIKNNTNNLFSSLDIAPTGADTIDGAASESINGSRCCGTYVSDGVSGWVLTALIGQLV